jgi:hypothetical protein
MATPLRQHVHPTPKASALVRTIVDPVVRVLRAIVLLVTIIAVQHVLAALQAAREALATVAAAHPAIACVCAVLRLQPRLSVAPIIFLLRQQQTSFV